MLAIEIVARDPGVLVIEIVALPLLVAVLALLAIYVRRRALQRGGGTIELSLQLKTNVPGTQGRGWVLGVGRFEGGLLRWYRVFSLAPGPRRELVRRDLVVVRRRPPTAGEARAMLAGAVVMECTHRSRDVLLAMDPSAVTGFLAWLEARPPGATLPR